MNKALVLTVVTMLAISGAFGQYVDILESDSSVQIREDSGSNSGAAFKTVSGSSKSSGSGAQFASFQEPSQEALGLKSRGNEVASARFSGSGLTSGSSNAQATQALRGSRWIRGGWGRQTTLWTKCFFNPCPKGEFFFYIRTTCSFTLYLIDQNGNVVQNLGNGNAWVDYQFRFFTKCGKYRIKIVLNCSCACAYACFKLRQNQSNCNNNCPDQFSHYFNPETCQCECSNKCNCPSGKGWKGYPACSCVCDRTLSCPQGQYWNKKNCRCERYPTCGCDFCPDGWSGSGSNSRGGSDQWDQPDDRRGRGRGRDDSYDPFKSRQDDGFVDVFGGGR